MKTIDLLVQALPAIGGWPEKVTHIGQDYDRELMFYGRGNVRSGIFLDQLAADHRKHGEKGTKITREQYEAALAAKNDGWIDWGGGECPVGASEMVDVIFGHGRRMSTNIADCWRWNHSGTSSDIIAYRLHKPQEAEQAEADDEAYLNECIGQDAAPFWNGEGLPPVGVECEYKWQNDRWRIGKVCYISKHTVLMLEIFDGEESESAYGVCDVTFRLIRSEADRKRDEAVKTIMLTGWCQAAAEEIYDLVAAGKVPGMKLED